MKISNYFPNQMLSTKEAASLIGWTPAWLRIRALAGDIPFIRPGERKMFFRAGDIAEFRGCKVEDL